ncbi:MAG: Ryanodine receptor Ryr, partial [Bacteroidetes bacterium]
EVEHRRWNAEQLLNGWVYGEMRNNELKIHDNIVPYAELTDRIKQYDRDAVINIPVILAAVKLKIDKKGT